MRLTLAAMDGQGELPRELGDLIRYGVVDEVDGARLRVKISDELVTGWIPIPSLRAGKVRIWIPLAEGEQVQVLCPEGDIAAATIGLSLFSDGVPPPTTSQDQAVVAFDDGATFTYDLAASKLDVVLPGQARVEAAGGVEFVANVKITGALEVTQNITGRASILADTDVKVGAISLKTHKHGNVQSGGSLSGGPQ